MDKKLGFTLSEVIISLVIIGIIAAMTTASLINNLNNQQYISAYKKMYSSISLAFNRIKFDNGSSMVGLFTSTDDCMEKFSEYFKGAKICAGGTTTGNCWHEIGKWYNLRGEIVNDNGDYTSSIILADGSIILFVLSDSECESSTGLYKNVGCAWVRTDVNGFKKPNIVGKDIFDFYILQDKVIARGDPLSTTDMDNTTGWGKGYKILSKGTL